MRAQSRPSPHAALASELTARRVPLWPTTRKGGEAYLTERAREQAERLVHKLFECPDAGRPPKDAGRLVSLPDTISALPREKPVRPHGRAQRAETLSRQPPAPSRILPLHVLPLALHEACYVSVFAIRTFLSADDIFSVAQVPQKVAQTKWEKFAEKKGIVKKKRSRMIFDEESEEYKPR